MLNYIFILTRNTIIRGYVDSGWIHKFGDHDNVTKQTRSLELMLAWCRSTVCDAGPTLSQHWLNGLWFRPHHIDAVQCTTPIYWYCERVSSKHETSTQRLFYVGPPSTTLVQHKINAVPCLLDGLLIRLNVTFCAARQTSWLHTYQYYAILAKKGNESVQRCINISLSQRRLLRVYWVVMSKLLNRACIVVHDVKYLNVSNVERLPNLVFAVRVIYFLTLIEPVPIILFFTICITT